ELESVVAGRDARTNLVNDLRRTVASDPAIRFQAVAHEPTEQLVHRHAERFALDVPERLVDAGDGAHEHRTAAVERAAIHGLPMIIDPCGVLANQLLAYLGHRSFDAAGAAFHHRLAPADQTFVGFHFEKHPARRNLKGRESRDSHAE